MIDLSMNQYRARQWEILPDALEGIITARAEKLRAFDLLPTVDDKVLAKYRDLVTPQMTVTRGGVAVIPVAGALMHDPDLFDRAWFGACSYRDVSDMLTAAMASDEIRAVVLNIDSPGGMVTGAVEVSEQVAELATVKPVVAFTDGEMCSAAYKISVGATTISATASACVGSIGTVMAFMDLREYYANAGARVQVFRSAPLKAAGWPGESLTDEQADNFQRKIDASGNRFWQLVKTYRPQIDDSLQSGDYVDGLAGLELGLIDSISDLSGAINDAELLADMADAGQIDEA